MGEARLARGAACSPGAPSVDAALHFFGRAAVRGDEAAARAARGRRPTPGSPPACAHRAKRGETLRETALREVREEAGVACVVARDLGAFADDAKLVRTTFYVMRVATSYAEWEDRDRGRLRRWWRAARAIAAITIARPDMPSPPPRRAMAVMGDDDDGGRRAGAVPAVVVAARFGVVPPRAEGGPRWPDAAPRRPQAVAEEGRDARGRLAVALRHRAGA